MQLNSVEPRKLRDPPYLVDEFALAKIDDRAFYVIGGYAQNYSGEITRPYCTKFDIKRSDWIRVSEMNLPRANHSACSLNGFIYVFGGRSSLDNELQSQLRTSQSIEKFDAFLDMRSNPKKVVWSLIELKDCRRSMIRSIVVPFVLSDEILIFGGQSMSEGTPCTYIFNVETEKIKVEKSLARGDFQRVGNNEQALKENGTVFFTTALNEVIHFCSYNRRDSDINIIDKIKDAD